MDIAIVTARAAAGRDGDEPLLLDALAAAGAEARVVAWDDPDVDWGAFDLAVVRSTWDYTFRLDEFLGWARSTAARTRLHNGPDVLAWNTDKTYLRELLDAGAPVVPTTFLAPGDEVRLPGGEIVVKPAVSAGSRNTARYTAGDPRAPEHVRRLLDAGRTVLVQPYQAGVDARGETALVFAAGRFSHAATKAALLVRGRGFGSDQPLVSDTRPAAGPTAAERDVAASILEAVPFDAADLLYARVDLVEGPDGSPLLLELELAEPSLFLSCAPDAAATFAAAVVEAATR